MIKICNIILSYLEENQKYFFWLNDWLISIEKKEKTFSIIYPTTGIFWHQSGHKCREPKILNALRLVYF